MVFINSLKLFGSNALKALKFFIFYVVVWGLSFALFLPVFFEFKNLIITYFQSISPAFAGVFVGSVGTNLVGIIQTTAQMVVDAFTANLGIAIYAIVVLFVFLPFFINVGKYTFDEMLYSYMTSKNELGFFSALVKRLKKSLLFALVKTFYNIAFLAITCFTIYGLATVNSQLFVEVFFPLCTFLILVIFFTVNQLTVLGWAPAMIVFDCNVFTAYRKGFKAVKRHFWATVGTTTLYFLLFWAVVMIFGIYTMSVLIPLMTAVLCVYDMTSFFTSQGMRYYVNANKILTPKKLEEVDNINKTAFIL